MSKKEMYLGDGVYASYDGYHIILDLRGQDSHTRIALDSSVYYALNKFVQSLKGDSHDTDQKG